MAFGHFCEDCEEGFCLIETFGFSGGCEFLTEFLFIILNFGEVLEVGFGTTFLIACFGVRTALGIHEEDAWKTLNGVAGLKLFVLGDGGFVHLRLVPRVVEFHEDVVFRDALLKGIVLKDFFVEFDAPSAPIGAGEINQKVFIFGCGLLFGGFKVVHPTLTTSEAEGGGQEGEGGNEGCYFHSSFSKGVDSRSLFPWCRIESSEEIQGETLFARVSSEVSGVNFIKVADETYSLARMYFSGFGCGGAVGNFDLNTKDHACKEHPALIYDGDVIGEGAPRIVEADFENKTLFSIRRKSCSTNAMLQLAKRLGSFHVFAKSELSEIYPGGLEKARKFVCDTLESGFLINDRSGQFTFRTFPRIAQIASVQGFTFFDFNRNGHLNLTRAQNFYNPQFETGPYAAAVGLLMVGDGAGTLLQLSREKVGFVYVVIPVDWRLSIPVVMESSISFVRSITLPCFGKRETLSKNDY